MSAIVKVDGGLLARNGNLVNECCCSFWCCIVGYDDCGEPIRECSAGRVDDSCSGPFESLDECDRECTPGPPCCRCECCEICVDESCYPCPDGYSCEDCQCLPPPPPPPPGDYYCCYNYKGAQPDEYDTAGQEAVRRSGTSCHVGPCGRVEGGVFIVEEWRTAGGPYLTAEDCADACRRHNCNPDPCGRETCTPDPNGTYETRDICYDSCDDPAEGPCGLYPEGPVTLTGSGAGTFNHYFYIGEAANPKICVAYVSKCGQPIRVQIWTRLLSTEDCSEIAPRVIVADSQWRGEQDCSCTDLPDGQSFKGAPRGFVKWRTKQRGITAFEVQVITLCPETDWEVVVTCGDCGEVPDWQCCCGCSTTVEGMGCLSIPTIPREELIVVEWQGLRIFNFPINQWYRDRTEFPDASSQKTFILDWATNIGLIFNEWNAFGECRADENGDYHIIGYVRTQYVHTVANAKFCTMERVWKFDYKINKKNDTGGEADVTLDTVRGDIDLFPTPPVEPCGEQEGLEKPTVTITIAP